MSWLVKFSEFCQYRTEDRMKVGLLIHNINNMGGIITYVERLAQGLRETGREVDILRLDYTEKASDSRTRSSGYEPGTTDILVHPIYGWDFPLKNRIPYKGAALQSAIDKLSQYDVLIWETPAPSMPVNRAERENLEWMQLFKNSAKQVITIHDGNLLGMYPHLLHAIRGVPNITATAPHPRGFKATKHLGIDSTMVMIPQYPPDRTITYEQKEKGFLACQIFKAWKHVDEPVRAISYMWPTNRSYIKARKIAGIGLHYYYMTSPDKCKHYHPASAPSWLAGKRIWDTALSNGMDYLGVVNFAERDKQMANTLLFLDPSWVDDGKGNHLNGAVPEAIRMGCIPVGKPLTFRESEDDNNSIYEPGINYLEIPQNAVDAEYAWFLEEFSALGKAQWQEMNEANQSILSNRFDYRHVANQLMLQATESVHAAHVPYHQNLGIGPSKELEAAAIKMLETFPNAT